MAFRTLSIVHPNGPGPRACHRDGGPLSDAFAPKRKKSMSDINIIKYSIDKWAVSCGGSS